MIWDLWFSLVTAEMTKVVIAMTQMNDCSKISDSLGESCLAKEPKPRTVPKTAIADTMSTDKVDIRASNRNAIQINGGMMMYSIGYPPEKATQTIAIINTKTNASS